MKTLIYGGRVIDPANGLDGQYNLLLEHGRIIWVGKDTPEADTAIDAAGKMVVKGAMFIIPLIFIVVGYVIYLKKYKIDTAFYHRIIGELTARGDLK